MRGGVQRKVSQKPLGQGSFRASLWLAAALRLTGEMPSIALTPIRNPCGQAGENLQAKLACGYSVRGRILN